MVCMNRGILPAFLILLTASLTAFSLVAHAGLGEKELSIERDRQNISGSRRSPKAQSNYTVHEILNDHLLIREYVADGVVFAVSWSGARHPDLDSLFGTYASDFQDASRRAAKVKGLRSRGKVQGEKIVVLRSGHLRSVSGVAYVPELLPPGMDVHEIR
ncbi:MAG: DUF2844 domain-containing protein [Bdellovibrionota bacterium]